MWYRIKYIDLKEPDGLDSNAEQVNTLMNFDLGMLFIRYAVLTLSFVQQAFPRDEPFDIVAKPIGFREWVGGSNLQMQ